MASNYPPGVSGAEPHLTGIMPVDYHRPFEAFDYRIEDIYSPEDGEPRYGYPIHDVRDGDPEQTVPVSAHPTFKEAEAVAHLRNRETPGCHFLVEDKGRRGCLVCGAPPWEEN